MTPELPVIDIRNATVYREGTLVLRRLTLRIDPGQSTVILGPNGAGKTTLLKLLSREIYPRHDDDMVLRLFGRDRWDVWSLRQHLGIVSQDLQYTYAGHVLGVEVALSGFYASVGTWPHQSFSAAQRQHANDLLRRLGVDHLAMKPFAALSTGEQRRFLLARALIHDPEALVLDEPTSGLDLRATFDYMATVRSLLQAGRTVILVTHHIHEIPPEIDRVVLLQHGEIVADGSKHEVLNDGALSSLYGTGIHLVNVNGYYQAMPAAD